MDTVSLVTSIIIDSVQNVATDSVQGPAIHLVQNLQKPLEVSERQNPLVITSLFLGMISSVAVVISALYAYKQFKRTKKFNGVKYVQRIREKLYDDYDIAEVLYWFDYDVPWYSATFHNTKDPQLKVDKTLSVLEYACYLKAKQFINNEQFSIIKYDIDRAITNNQVQEYLYNLHHWTKLCNTNMSFSFLLQYGRDKGVINDEFDNKNSALFRHFLNC